MPPFTDTPWKATFILFLTVLDSQKEVARYEALMNDVITPCGGYIRRIAEGRARYRSKYGSLCQKRMGRKRFSGNETDQGVV